MKPPRGEQWGIVHPNVITVAKKTQNPSKMGNAMNGFLHRKNKKFAMIQTNKLPI